jgi:hypothetical protein
MTQIKVKLLCILLIIASASKVSAQSNAYLNFLNSEIQKIQKELAPDLRTAVFSIKVNKNQNTPFIFTGETNLPEAKSRVIKLLKKGMPYLDSIRILPEPTLGEQIWAITNFSTSNIRKEPDHTSELVSQTLMGTPLLVLDYRDGWYRIQTPDSYIGWMDQGGLSRFTGQEMDRWKRSNRYVFNRIFGNVFVKPISNLEIVSDLVLNCIFEVVSEENGFLKVKLPDGRSGYVIKGDCLSWNEWINRKPDSKQILELVSRLVGLPYFWGGTSCKNMDCSGLTKTAYYSQGVILARDASQQARYGQALDINLTRKFLAGDLLFFGPDLQHIVHVGLYLGNTMYIHASSSFGMVHVNSLDPENMDYVLNDSRKLLAARRILSSLNTEGVVMVKDHPWYSIIN